jgi:hypothetical protein
MKYKFVSSRPSLSLYLLSDAEVLDARALDRGFKRGKGIPVFMTEYSSYRVEDSVGIPVRLE